MQHNTQSPQRGNARPPRFVAAPGQTTESKEPNPSHSLRVAVYARFSTDGQKATSIEDQIRTCQETATRHGLIVSDALVFADAAVSGSEKSLKKREQYHALRAAVSAGRVDVIICDQSCRLARHATEALSFFDELKSKSVQLLTADGFDSEQPTAQLLFGMKSVFSQFFLDETRHRVRRGMSGGFERGSMVTAIPYGYELDAERSAKAQLCQWRINQQESDVVQEIFRCRRAGMSFHQIAAVLNGRGVATPRATPAKTGLYWRAAAIWRILQNPIYKGVYQVNFGPKSSEPRQLSQRLMPELALVSINDWDACQTQGKRSPPASEAKLPGSERKRGPRGTYGGGKHPFAGLIRCNVCGVHLSCHHAKGEGGSIHCIQCEHATASGVPGRQPQHISIKGVRLLLGWLLEKVVSGDALERYRSHLKTKLEGGREGELTIARAELAKSERTQLRLAKLLGELSADDPMLEQQYLRVREESLHQTRRVRELEEGMRQLNQEAIRKQLDIDLSAVVDAFLSDRHAPERTRALLRRVFPKMVLLGKTDRYTAIFEVHIKPGAILAEASGTAELANVNEVMHVRLNTSGSKHPVWSVEQIQVTDAEGNQEPHPKPDAV